MPSNTSGEAKLDLDGAIEFLMRKGEPFVKDLVESFGDARFPATSPERQHCEAILAMFRDYTQREDPSRPLSIAVFGPPGSGKSFIVKQLARQASGMKELQKLNLSQLNSPAELTDWLSRLPKIENNETPLLFFDEFDAALNSEELGWLRWFLAPMWDGEFVHEGKTQKLKKAVFVFAGGTAERFEEFEERHADYFVNRKGPDFVSRLCGFLNIEGLNTYGSGRYLTRALVLQHQLGERSAGLKNKGNGTLNIERNVLQLLLAGGNYIHGARSLQAILDMSTLTNTDKFRSDDLPPDELRKLHVNRGPLDRMTVGISAGQEPSSQVFFEKLAKALIERGAVLAYGGSSYEGDTLASMVKVVKQFPDELIRRDEKRIRNFLAYPSFLKKESWDARTEEISKCVDFDEMYTLSAEEQQDLVDPACYFTAWSDNAPYVVENHLAWSLSLFRMRLRLVQEIQALVVIGGKGGERKRLSKSDKRNAKTMPWGRFPGVAEEVMLALAFNIPVYVLGISGGASEAIGNLMGLARIHSDPLRWLQKPLDSNYERLVERLAMKSASFEVPHKPDLPQTFEELREFFRDRRPDTGGWRYNGLSAAENRELFDCKQDDRCVDLIIRGITRLDWAEVSPADNSPKSKTSASRIPLKRS